MVSLFHCSRDRSRGGLEVAVDLVVASTPTTVATSVVSAVTMRTTVAFGSNASAEVVRDRAAEAEGVDPGPGL